MDNQSFDNVTRQAAAGVSRRRSLIALAAAGLVTTLASPFTAHAKEASAEKKGRKKKKTKKQPPPDLCAPQVEECTALLTNLCAGQTECQDSIACCSFLGTCRASAFIACFVASQSD